jgi:hypothetical protein
VDNDGGLVITLTPTNVSTTIAPPRAHNPNSPVVVKDDESNNVEESSSRHYSTGE